MRFVCSLLMPHRAGPLFFFFFQAEDGIRDVAVTGVQTCALPISGNGPASMISGQLVSGDFFNTLGLRAAAGRVLELDRKSGVEGKRVDLGGRRIIKKKKR